MDKDQIEKQRARLRKNIEMMEAQGVKYAKEIDTTNLVSYVVTNTVEDYDLDYNVVFRNRLNRSYPTKYKCTGKCKRLLVMSRAVKKMYEKAKKKAPKRVKAICLKCSVDSMTKHIKKYGSKNVKSALV